MIGSGAPQRLIDYKRTQRQERINALVQYKKPLTRNDERILAASIPEIRDLVAKGDLDPQSVLAAYAKQTLLVHERTNCLTEIVIPDAEKWAANVRRDAPLAGIPVSIKDNFGIGGYDVSMGFASRTQKPRPSDSSLIRLLKDAGAIPYVKTNVPMGMMSAESSNPVWGTTSNPHNAKFGPGGSSSGEAALIAGGGSRIGIGTDIGGSVREPAHFCGIYSLRMTYARFPRANDDATTPGFEGVPDVASPLARTLRDLRFFIEGVFAMKPWTYCYQMLPLPWREVEQKPARELKVGVLRRNGYVLLTPPVSRALDEAAKALKRQGCKVVDFELPQNGKVYNDLYEKLTTGDGFELVSRPILPHEQADPVIAAVRRYAWLPGIFRFVYKLASRVAHYFVPGNIWFLTPHELDMVRKRGLTEYYDLIAERERLREEMWHHWRANEIDFLISPPHQTTAVPLDFFLPVYAYSSIWNVLDYPAGIVPVTTVDPEKDKLPPDFDVSKLNRPSRVSYARYDPVESAGLPAGVQVVAQRFQDEEVLNAMSLLDSALSH